MFLIGTTTSISTKGVSDYDPWCDFDDDGDIDIYDIVEIAGRYGTAGTPVNKTALLYNISNTFSELLSIIDSLNTTVIELENTVNYLNTTVIYLNETIICLNASQSALIYSDSSASSTSSETWTVMKSWIMPANTTSGGILICWNARMSGSPHLAGGMTAQCRLAVNGTVKAYASASFNYGSGSNSWGIPDTSKMYFVDAMEIDFTQDVTISVEGIKYNCNSVICDYLYIINF